jgi:hypothetical protein
MINEVRIEGSVVYLKKIDDGEEIMTDFTIKTKDGDYFYISMEGDIDIKEGMDVLVEGRLKQIRWASFDGKWRSMVKIIGKNIQVKQKQKKKKKEIKPFKIEF